MPGMLMAWRRRRGRLRMSGMLMAWRGRRGRRGRLRMPGMLMDGLGGGRGAVPGVTGMIGGAPAFRRGVAFVARGMARGIGRGRGIGMGITVLVPGARFGSGGRHLVP